MRRRIWTPSTDCSKGGVHEVTSVSGGVAGRSGGEWYGPIHLLLKETLTRTSGVIPGVPRPNEKLPHGERIGPLSDKRSSLGECGEDLFGTRGWEPSGSIPTMPAGSPHRPAWRDRLLTIIVGIALRVMPTLAFLSRAPAQVGDALLGRLILPIAPLLTITTRQRHNSSTPSPAEP